MKAHLWHGYPGRWSWRLVFWLFLMVACWPAQGRAGGAQGTRRDNPQGWARVTVDQGRLSVDLRDAEVGEVLSQIAQQTGIPILVSPSAEKRVSVQFTGLELDKGLRRLMRLASVSYTILYAPRPAGVVAISEIRVFGEATEGAPRQPIVAEQDTKESAEDIGQRFAAALAQAQATSPAPAANEESEAARRFREMLERAR